MKRPQGSEQTEPLSGVQGEGSKEEPFDQGNQEEEDLINRGAASADAREPVSGEKGEEAFDRGNEA